MNWTKVEQKKRSNWRLILFILWIEALLVFFCTVFAFVLFQALLFAAVSTYRFQANDSLIGFTASLRLRNRPAWKNRLWFVSNACAFGLVAFAFVRSDARLFPVPRPPTELKGTKGLLAAGIISIAMGTGIILGRKSMVERNRKWRKFTHQIGFPYQSDRWTEINAILVGAIGIIAGVCLLIAPLVLRLRE